jgi:glutathione synthase
MTARLLRMLFLMDPVEGEDWNASTTIILMLEAQRRGHEVLYADPADLSVHGRRAAALVTPVSLDRAAGDLPVWGASRRAILDDEIDVVFQRKDPPVDAAYVSATQILGTCERALVLNRPTSVVAYNEKLLALHFRDLMPETMVTRHMADLEEFMDSLGGEMIVKPLDGKGGEGIFHIVKGERNIASILEQTTAFETRWVMAQQYLPEVRQGDKRVLLLEGEPLGALLRVPSDNEVRANLHVGGRAAKASLDDADRRIVERLSPLLRREGLFFVGIDVIGGYLTEINLTSPTGMQEVNALDGVCLELRVMDRVEELVESGATRV